VKFGFVGDLDPAYVGLLADEVSLSSSKAVFLNSERFSVGLSLAELFAGIESDEIQIGVVSLESVLEFVSQSDQTSVRILGSLLEGDCRSFFTLCEPQDVENPCTLGASDADAALARWEAIHRIKNFRCSEKRGEKVLHGGIRKALVRGRYSVLEVNAHWEGLLGCRRGLVRNSSKADHYGIPSGASHLIVTNEVTVRNRREELIELRSKIFKVYENFLDNPEKFTANFTVPEISGGSTQRSFLRASARVIAPHLIGFLRDSGAPPRSRIRSFCHWYEEQVLPRRNSVGADGKNLLSRIEHIFCDLWT
jgi:hypothetical protein